MLGSLGILPQEILDNVLEYLLESPKSISKAIEAIPDLQMKIENVCYRHTKNRNIYGANPIAFLHFEKYGSCLFCPNRRYLKTFDNYLRNTPILRVCTGCMYKYTVSTTQAKQRYMINCNEYALPYYTYCNQYNVVCKKYIEFQVKKLAFEVYGDNFYELLEKRRIHQETLEHNKTIRRDRIIKELGHLPESLIYEKAEVMRYINTGRPTKNFEDFVSRISAEIKEKAEQESRLIKLEKALNLNGLYMHSSHSSFRSYVYHNYGSVESIVKEAIEETWLKEYTDYKSGYENAKRRALRSWFKKPIVFITEKPPKEILNRLVLPMLNENNTVVDFEIYPEKCTCGNEVKYCLDYRYYDACSNCVSHYSVQKHIYTCGLECINNYLELDYRYRRHNYVEFVCYKDDRCYNCQRQLWISVDVNGVLLD